MDRPAPPDDARGPAQAGPDLPGLRAGIDRIDDQLLALLNERARLAGAVAELKNRAGSAFYVPERERAILERLIAANPGPFPEDAIPPVFQEIISACLSLEKTVRVAYLGPEGTFTHMAVKRRFGRSARALPSATIAGVFDDVERGRADFGVLPIENAAEGAVGQVLDALARSSLRISAEVVLRVDHCLVARPGVALSDIARLYSHPGALAECRRWLAANLPRALIVEAASTAEAARLARDDAQGAAVAAALAARLHDLEVLRAGLADSPDNVTRFVVIGHLRPRPSGTDRTSIFVEVDNVPGVLHRVLSPFAARALNVSRIESRPSRRHTWSYVFYLDVDGHEDDPMVAAALAEVACAGLGVKVLGSYPRGEDTPGAGDGAP